MRETARMAFRDRRGRPLLQEVKVAGKSGSLNGEDPDGRYEWLIGVAPVERPTIAIAVVSVQAPLYWVSASQIAAEVLGLPMERVRVLLSDTDLTPDGGATTPPRDSPCRTA